MSTDSELKEIIAECYTDTKLFARTLFPELFFSPFSVLHDQIFDLIDHGGPRVAIAAPRGIGKTTIARTVAAKSIVYRDKHFIPYIQNSATVAEMQTENMKNDLLTTQDIKKVFGNIRVSDYVSEDASTNDMFSKLSWIAYGSTLIFPRGAGQQIRGINWRNHRPDLLIIDDLEKKEETQNEELRTKLKYWFYSDVMKCINKYKKDYKFIYIDTLKHEDSLMQELLDASDWDSISLELCDDNLVSNAPHYMTDEELQEEWDSHKEKGKTDVFFMEYRNKVTGGDFNSFKKSYFKYYDEQELQSIKNELETIVIYDPAKTVNPLSADTAIIGVSLHAQSARIFIRDAVAEKLHPDEQYKMAFETADMLGAKVIGREVTSLNEFITQPMDDYMHLRGGQFYEMVDLKAKGGASGKVESKAKRVKAMIPYYRQGTVYHNPTCCGKLEGQLLSYPFSKLWDLMDCLAYIPQMFNLGGRGFAPQISKEEEELWNDEDEFAELEESYEPALNWNHAII